MTNEVLNQLSNHIISPKEAYKQLYTQPKPRRFRRAHWIKLRIVDPNDKKATRLLGFFLGLPIPLFIVRMILRKVKLDEHDIPFERDELLRMITTKGILINVTSQDGQIVYIKTI